MAQLGRPSSPPSSVVHLRVPTALLDRIRERAVQGDRPINSEVTRILREVLALSSPPDGAA